MCRPWPSELVQCIFQAVFITSLDGKDCTTSFVATTGCGSFSCVGKSGGMPQSQPYPSKQLARSTILHAQNLIGFLRANPRSSFAHYQEILGSPSILFSHFILHSSFFILHSSFFILHSSFFILHSSFFILHSSFFILHSSFFILHSSFFILHSSSFILHPSCGHRSKIYESRRNPSSTPTPRSKNAQPNTNPWVQLGL